MRKTADAALDVIIDSDEDWAVKIRKMKFESHNQEWLAVIEVRRAAGESTRVVTTITKHCHKNQSEEFINPRAARTYAHNFARKKTTNPQP